VKKQSKSAKKKTRREQDKRRRREAERKHRQAAEQAEAQLWQELQPRAQGYNLEDDDEFIEFASHVMHDSADLYDEPEFKSIVFDPADAMLVELGSFNATVPAPEKLEQLSDEEHQAIVEDAQVRAVAQLVTPKLQRDVLKVFKQCRQRLQRERKTDQLALASATEMLLRNDARPIIWATCGVLHKAFSEALDQAFELQKAEEEALKAAKAIQPDIEQTQDLEEGTPAYAAFWDAADKTPGLVEYLERAEELESTLFEAQRKLNAELTKELFDPEEIEELVYALSDSIHEQGVDLDATDQKRGGLPIAESTFSDVLKDKISPERFQEILRDLDSIIEAGDEMDEVVQRARVVRDDLTESKLPHWENFAFQRLCLDGMVADVLGSEDEDDEEA
jgi:hypothetical protein